MHRLVVTSATYRQSSRLRADVAEKDPRNLLLARQQRLRLEGEIGALHGLRDVKLELTLAETDPDVLDRLLDLELPLARKVSLDATLHRPGEQALRLDGEAKVGSSRFSLALTAQRTATVPLIKGRITSARIQAVDFWDRSAVTSPAHGRSADAQGPDNLGLLGIVPGLDFVLQDSLDARMVRTLIRKQKVVDRVVDGAVQTDLFGEELAEALIEAADAGDGASDEGAAQP